MSWGFGPAQGASAGSLELGAREERSTMQRKVGRRGFLGGSLAAGAAAAGFIGPEGPRPPAVQEEKPKDAGISLPTGKLGKLAVSRLIAGGNLIGGYCHSRDLLYVSNLARAYLSEAKRFDTLALYEKFGVNTIAVDPGHLKSLKKYRQERGGRMQTIVQIYEDKNRWENPSWDGLKPRLDRAMDEGADSLYLQGAYADMLVQKGKPENLDLIGKALDYIRGKGCPAGLGSHALEVPQACDRHGVTPDFYFKTFHHDRYWSATPKERRKRFCVDGPRSLDHNEYHDNIFCIDPEETAEYMKKKEQPWIAFKVLAGGAILPKSGLQYAFENGADFVAMGMFDFEVMQDVLVAQQVLDSVKDRPRPWRA